MNNNKEIHLNHIKPYLYCLRCEKKICFICFFSHINIIKHQEYDFISEDLFNNLDKIKLYKKLEKIFYSFEKRKSKIKIFVKKFYENKTNLDNQIFNTIYDINKFYNDKKIDKEYYNELINEIKLIENNNKNLTKKILEIDNLSLFNFSENFFKNAKKFSIKYSKTYFIKKEENKYNYLNKKKIFSKNNKKFDNNNSEEVKNEYYLNENNNEYINDIKGN